MVRDSGDPALIKAVETGNISVSATAKGHPGSTLSRR
jgi:hypothetical protein